MKKQRQNKANSPFFLTRLFKIALGFTKIVTIGRWHLATVDKFGEQLDNYALPPQFWTDENGKEMQYKKLICNWNKEESTDLIARFKAKGMKPYWHGIYSYQSMGNDIWQFPKW